MILITVKDFPEKLLGRVEDYTNMPVIWTDDMFNEDIDFSKVEIFITYGHEVNEKSLSLLTNLKWIQIFQTGIDRLPLHLIDEHIIISNIKDIYGKPMSEYAMSIILYEVREIEQFNVNKQQKLYDRLLVEEANQLTLGIFGTGLIGQEVAKRAKAFDMDVLGLNSDGRAIEYFDKTYTPENRNEMIEQCDFIVLLMPLTEETRHIIDYEQFEHMKNNAYIINIGRSGLINKTALIDSLKNNRIKGAALDVFEKEPLPKHSELWDIENVLITPHISGKTKYFFHRCLEVFETHFDSYKADKEMKFTIDRKRQY